MTVYIEYVLIDNFVIDCLLLSLTAKILKMQFRRRWLFLCSFIGSILALTYPVFSLNNIYSYLYRILGSIAVTLPLTIKTNVKKSLLFIAVFYFFTFLMGGMIIAIYKALGLDYSTKISVGLMLVPCFIIAKFIKFVARYVLFDIKENKNTVICELKYKNNVVKCKGYFDSGNFLKDKNGNSIAICSYKTFIKLIGNDLTKLKDKVAIQSVSGSNSIYVINIDALKIYFQDDTNIFNNVTIGMGKSFSFFDILLGNGFLEAFSDDVDIKKMAN